MNYHEAENEYRFGVWKENYYFVEKNNAESKTLKLHMNKFGAMKIEEFS